MTTAETSTAAGLASATAFNRWLSKQRKRTDAVGELARFAKRNRQTFPPYVRRYADLRKHFDTPGRRDLLPAAGAAWEEFTGRPRADEMERYPRAELGQSGHR